MSARVHFDITPAVVTAWCDCGWVDLASTPAAARTLAATHRYNVHPRLVEGDRVREIRGFRDAAT